MLTLSEVVLFLLERRLVHEQWIVAGDLEITEASRRNRNIVVKSNHGPSYLLKEGLDSQRNATLANEANVYEFIRTSPTANEIRDCTPKFYGHDIKHSILIIEYLPHAQDLRAYHTQHKRFSLTLAKALGEALGGLHSLTEIAFDSGFSVRLPWILDTVHHPTLEVYQNTSSANLRLLKIIQEFPEYCSLLDDLRQDWQNTSLIHADIKWDNCIAFSRFGSTRRHHLSIVDWELAGIGDPCWDVGSAFCDYLWFWISSILAMDDVAPEQLLALAQYPLERMHPAIGVLWVAYKDRMRLNQVTAERWLLLAVRYAAARLVQTAYESMQNSARPSSTTICALQLALNILKRPHEAAQLLLKL